MNSTNNRYRKHKSSMLIQVLPINENTVTYTFTMVRWKFEIIVKSQKRQNKPKIKKHNNNKMGGRGGGIKRQINSKVI